jgi:hypothetical protein
MRPSRSRSTDARGARCRPLHRRLLVCAALCLGAAPAASTRAQTTTASPRVAEAALAPLADSTFARLVESLSEPGGFFDTDNLISNERSYLHALSALDRVGVRGGAYIGVGPDQSFSYIAHTRSELAFLLDVRRDNLLQHLLFKVLFAQAPNRAVYLALWLGRPLPDGIAQWAAAPLDEILQYMTDTPVTPASRAAAHEAVRSALRSVRVPLSASDLATISRFHDSFINAGLSLRFTTFGRPPRPYYPTLGDLLRETARDGQRASYLATEASFQYVKELQRRNRVIPVVGNLAGPSALRAIGGEVRAQGLTVSVLYASNAEDYVLRDGLFAQYANNVRALPSASRSVIVRSWFGGPDSHPHAVPGYFSTQLVQTFADFTTIAATGPWSYGQLAFAPHVTP